MRRLLTPTWLGLHLLAAVLVAGMLWLGFWQYLRAAGGNAISWGYALQWPVFAAFVVFIWVREVRRTLRPETSQVGDNPASPQPASAAARRPLITRPAAPLTYDSADDPELAAYNDYLAWLNAHPGARPTDYPGGN